MLRFGRRIGVAVSGGADSVCLLHVLASLAPELGLQLRVLHVNHGLRGDESEGDARFVEELAASLGLEAFAAGLDPAKLRKGNLEQNARRERLRLFARWRVELGLDAIALGHTRTDQAETVLLRLIRGSGPAGLVGIQPVTQDARIRPMIDVSAHAVRSWLSARGFVWREDSSNRSEEMARNRVRSKIMPALAAENPQVEAALARLAELAWEDEQYWAPLVEASLESARVCEETSIILDLKAVMRLEQALARRVLRAAAARARGGAEGLDLDHYEALYRLASARRDGLVTLAGLTAMRSFDQLRIARGDQGARQDIEVNIPGLGEYGESGVAVRLSAFRRSSEEIRQSQEFSPGCRYNGGRDWLDGDRIAFPLVLRVWRAGDRYQPFGARREYSLHELFQRERVPRWERGCWPVIVSGERIVWSRRFGAADWAAAAPGSANLIEVREAGTGE